MSGRLLVLGGEVVSPRGQRAADVVVEGERIAEVAEPGTVRPAEGDEVIDATGCLVLPGGVDTHTHLLHMSASGHTLTADDFRTGGEAAIAGGTTTIVDFVRARAGENVTDAFARRLAEAENATVDHGFHVIVPADADAEVFARLAALAAEHGATSWKFFMAYPGSMVDDATLIEGMRAAAAAGVLPIVHAENGHIVQDATDRLVAAGRRDEYLHEASHPVVAEVEAIHRAAAIAEWAGSPVFVVHVSSAAGAEALRQERDRGVAIAGETCPQYLLKGLEDYEGLGFEAAAYVCSPPIRGSANQEGLWAALADPDSGIVSVGTDHAPFSMEEQPGGWPQKSQGRGDFTRIPNGVPGIEERLLLLAGAGRLTMPELVDAAAERPARVFGLYPRKGVIAPGSDADLVVWDPARTRRIDSATVRSRAGYSIYDGTEVVGAPREVIARGELVLADDEVRAEPGRGRYLPRDPVSADDLAAPTIRTTRRG